MSTLHQHNHHLIILIIFLFCFLIAGHPSLDGKDFTVDGINGFGGKKKKKKRRHSRTIFTSYQLDELEKAFKDGNYLKIILVQIKFK